MATMTDNRITRAVTTPIAVLLAVVGAVVPLATASTAGAETTSLPVTVTALPTTNLVDGSSCPRLSTTDRSRARPGRVMQVRATPVSIDRTRLLLVECIAAIFAGSRAMFNHRVPDFSTYRPVPLLPPRRAKSARGG